MDRESKELFERILKSASLDKELEVDIRLHLAKGFFESQCIAREDLYGVFTDIKIEKVTDRQMSLIADEMKKIYLCEIFWDNLRLAASKVLKIVGENLPDCLKDDNNNRMT